MIRLCIMKSQLKLCVTTITLLVFMTLVQPPRRNFLMVINTPKPETAVTETVDRFLTPRPDTMPLCNTSDYRALDCLCDPWTPISVETPQWRNHHKNISHIANLTLNLDVLFLGDSIVEQWTGTKFLGRRPLPEQKKTFDALFVEQNAPFRGLGFGSAGDLVQHLLWHVQNGYLSPSIRPRVVWILIGTNNFFHKCTTVDSVVSGILQIARHVHHQKPRAKVVLQGLLPRGDSIGSLSLGYAHERIMETNQKLRSICDQVSWLHSFQIPAELFLEARDRRVINKELLRDGVHPSAKGYQVMGQLIQPELKRLLMER